MSSDRRYVLAGIVAALGLLTGAILLDVLGTILFAITVAYVLVPVQGWLVRRGVSEWTGAALATLLGFLSVVAIFSPIVATIYFRLEALEATVRGLPNEVPLTAFGMTYTIEAQTVQVEAVAALQNLAYAVGAALPVLAIKFALFVSLLFALLLKGDAAARAAVAPVPHGYRDVVYALAVRARETLYAIYVLQVATAAGTLLLAYPLFVLLGYDAAFTMALVAGILQFVPIVGPSMLVLLVALYHLATGDVASAALVTVLGLTVVGWIPDAVVRPRLARRSAGMPGSLYFVGFTGGLFTLGPVGIVVGPLVVAVFAEAVELLADEVNADAMDDFEALGEEMLPADVDAPADPDGDPAPGRGGTVLETSEDDVAGVVDDEEAPPGD